MATATASAEPSSGSVAEPSSSSRTSECGVGETREAIEIENVRGKGGEFGLDGLRVADIGEKCSEDGKARRSCGYGESCLGHHGEQCRGLEGDGFATCVGAADDELARVGGEFKRERNNATINGAQVLLEQRMAGGVKAKQIGRDGRGHAIVVAGEAGAGEKRIDEGEHTGTLDQRLSIAAHLTGERDKDAMDLGLFLFEEADEFVVLLDGFEGLDVDGLAGRADAVNYAGDAALEFAANGDDEAVAANGDEVFLRGAVAGELAECGAEALFNLTLLPFLLTTNAAEFRRGVVGECAVGLNGALDGFGQRSEAGGQR